MKSKISEIIIASFLFAGIFTRTVCAGGFSANMLRFMPSSIKNGEELILRDLLQGNESSDEELSSPNDSLPYESENGCDLLQEEPDDQAGDFSASEELLEENEVWGGEELWAGDELLPEEDLETGSYEVVPDEDELIEMTEEEPPALEEQVSDELIPEEPDTDNNHLPEADFNEDIQAEGGYVFYGYLEDGIPNYIWEGAGEPSAPDNVPIKLTGISATSEYGNFIAETQRRRAYHRSTAFSSTVESTMKDGLHTIGPGKVRVYKGGRYFIDGGFALDGKIYYADETGFLISGWMKALIDTSVQDAASIINDKKFCFRFFDRKSYVMQTGYHKIDGLWHYFRETSGIMEMDRPVIIDGKYYYADQYGICEQVRLRNGNILISENNQNNDAYLAKYAVNAVDINTFTGQSGDYSFRPKWYTGKTTMELFGCPEVLEDRYGFYCPLRDNSLEGKIGCIYRNIGRYKGRELDLKITVTGYDLYSFCGDNEVGYYFVERDAIYLCTSNLNTISYDLAFLDHETGNETEVKAYMTFTDIDIGQSISILTPADEIFVDKDCVLYKDPESNTFTSPFISTRVGNAVVETDREYWVQVNFTGSHMSVRQGNVYDTFVFAESGFDIAGGSRNIWAGSYTGSAYDYSIINAAGGMVKAGQGICPRRLGRVSIPPISKTVSDKDEIYVTENRLFEDELSYTYTLSHNVPGENEEFYYDSYMVSDEFEEGLIIDKNRITVTSDNDFDVTGLFDIRVDGRKVEFRARPDILKSDSFYDNNYNYHIPVTIEQVDKLKNKDANDYIIYNECSAEFSRLGSSEAAKSNKTETRIRIPLSFGSIIITKRISETDIVWAHGNPTFIFRAEGEDEDGVFHRYEEYLCFQKGKYAVTGDGFAEISVTIPHVPCGTYRVSELPVMDYYLTAAEAATKNMSITAVGEPGKGKDPSLTAFGTGILTREAPESGIIFYDAKSSYGGYRHTDVVCNTLPLSAD